MIKKSVIFLTLVVLTMGLMAFTTLSSAPCTGSSGIVVSGADATWCNTSSLSATLTSLLDTILPRPAVFYADAGEISPLDGPGTALNGALALISARVFVIYSDALDVQSLDSTPTELNTALDDVGPRVFAAYGDATTPQDLESPSTGFLDIIRSIADRTYIAYSDANAFKILAEPVSMQIVLDEIKPKVFFSYADASSRQEMIYPCDLFADNAAPVLVNDVTKEQLQGTMVLSWTTDEVSTAILRYGTSSNSYNRTVTQSSYLSEHSFALGALETGFYFYQIELTDRCNNTTFTVEDVFEYAPEPAVEITKTAFPDPAVTGGDVTYTIRVFNTGDTELNATIVDTLPGNVTPSGDVTWNVTLQPGQIWRETLIVSVDDDFSGTLTNEVEVTTSEGVSDTDEITIDVVDSAALCDATLISTQSSQWDNAATWNLNRVPNSNDVVLILPQHTITAASTASVAGLCNYGTIQTPTSQSMTLIASGFITNTGSILGADGANGSSAECGRAGSSVELRGSPIYNEGQIAAGNGGNGSGCAGDGGRTMIFGRNTTNHGTICGGVGGDLTGTGSGRAGNGGDTHIWGKSGGPGFLLNDGLTCAGDGGNANSAATVAQSGGRGGTLKLISLPSVFLSGGRHWAGFGGSGAAGGRDGRDGRVIIEPNVIDLSGPETEIKGGDVLIFGGTDWTLDLSDMNGMAIEATNNITLSVGTGSMIDMRGNDGPIMQAGGQVVVSGDVIEIDDGVTVEDLVDAPNVQTGEAKIIYDLSVAGPSELRVDTDSSNSLDIMLTNNGPSADSYTLVAELPAGWQLSGLPSTTAIGGIDTRTLSLQVTAPADAEAGVYTMSVTATSQADPTVTETLTLELEVSSGESRLYLPFVTRQ